MMAIVLSLRDLGLVRARARGVRTGVRWPASEEKFLGEKFLGWRPVGGTRSSRLHTTDPGAARPRPDLE